jgi:hypothetical protein
MRKIIYPLLSLSLAALLPSLPGFAQTTKLHLGLTTAFSSTMVLDKGLSEDPRYTAKPTYNFAPLGLTAGADFGRGFGLQLESIFSQQGQTYEIIDVAKKVVGERRIELTYVHLPLLLRSFSTGPARARFNFMFGPQLSLLTRGQEVYAQFQAGRLVLPEGQELPANATDYNSADRTYTSPVQQTTILSTEADKAVEQFKKTDLQVAVGLGLDIDLGGNLYLSTQLRGNYGFVDVRNEDLLNAIKTNTGRQFTDNMFGRRANVVVGLQMGLHWMFGGNRSSMGTTSGIPER